MSSTNVSVNQLARPVKNIWENVFKKNFQSTQKTFYSVHYSLYVLE